VVGAVNARSHGIMAPVLVPIIMVAVTGVVINEMDPGGAAVVSFGFGLIAILALIGMLVEMARLYLMHHLARESPEEARARRLRYLAAASVRPKSHLHLVDDDKSDDE